MPPKWLQDFVSSLRLMAPRIEVTLEGGRLIQTGDYYYHRDVDRDITCYKDVHCYTEKGIGVHYREIFQVLQRVHGFLWDRERGYYKFNMYSFSSINEHLNNDKLFRFLNYDKKHMQPMNSMPGFAKSICARAGTEVNQANPYIPTLSDVRRDDLALVFSRTSIKINETSEGDYNRNKRHFFWFFLDGPEPKFIHGNKFQPDFIPVADFTINQPLTEATQVRLKKENSMSKNYYVIRTDDDTKKWIWEQIQAGKLCQGWGVEGMQLKENGVDVPESDWTKSFIRLAKEAWSVEVTEDQAKARYWILKPMTIAKTGDVVLIPKMPSWDTFTLVTVDDRGYEFDHSPTEQRGSNDYRHTLYVKEPKTFNYAASEQTRLIKGKMRGYQSAVNNVWNPDFQKVVDELLTMPSDEKSKSITDVFRNIKDDAVSKTLDRINRLPWREIEKLVQELFVKEGYEVLRTNEYDKKGGDADLVLGMKMPLVSEALDLSLNVYIQVKQKVGKDASDEDHVKQVVQIAAGDPSCIKMVISTADDFSDKAQQLASLDNVLLVNGRILAKMLIENL